VVGLLNVGRDIAVWCAEDWEERCDEVNVDCLGDVDGSATKLVLGVDVDDVVGEWVAFEMLWRIRCGV
jgi:hypothetical protein